MTEAPRQTVSRQTVSGQTLSELLDGECSGPQVHDAIDALLTDEALRQRWERYHLIRHVIARQPVTRDLRTIAPRVREALAPETVLTMTPRRQPRQLRQFAPLTAAIAAGFALVAMVLVPFGPADEFAPGPLSADAPVADQRPESGRPQDDPLLRARLEQLVVSHHEQAAGPGLAGFVSYATVVGRPDQR